MIDCHTHLDDPRLLPDVQSIAADFEKDGIEFVIDASSDLDGMINAVALAEKFDRIYATVGFHPSDCEAFCDKTAMLMESYAKNPKVVAVGEIGLDYHYDTPPRETQRKAFVSQLGLAAECGLPVVLHVRDAYGDALETLKANRGLLKNGVLLHCYSGSAEMAAEFLKFDCFFSFGGAITFKNARKEEVIRAIPREKLLTETDAPYLTPEPFRGKLNSPKYIKYVYEKIAAVLGVSFAETESLVRKNAAALFGRIKI